MLFVCSVLLHIIKACVSSQLSLQSSQTEFAALHLVVIKDKQADTVHAQRQMNRTPFFSFILRWVGGEIKTKFATLAMLVSVYVCVCTLVCVCLYLPLSVWVGVCTRCH